MRLLCFWLSLIAAAPASVWAQEHTQEHTLTQVHPASENLVDPAAFVPTLDVGDLWHDVRHQKRVVEDEQLAAAKRRERFFVVAPTIGSKPSTGLSVGLNGNLALFTGDEATTHISSVSGGLRVSQKQQVLSGVRYSMFTADDRWFIAGDNRLQWTSLNTYSLGGDALSTDTENVKYTALRLYEIAYRNVRPHLFIGAGVNVSMHADVRPGDGVLPTFDQSAYVAYNNLHGFSPDRQISAGPGLG